IKDDELIELYTEKESIEAGVNEAEKSYYAIRGSIDELEKTLREIQKSKENIDVLVMDLQQSLNEVKLTLNGLKEMINVEFEIDLAAIMAEQPEIHTQYREKAEAMIREEKTPAKEQLEKRGHNNPITL